MLRLAIQAKGRLSEETLALLADAGIELGASKRRLITRASGFPMEGIYLRDDDIPQAVAMGVADIGIVGLNEVAEKEEKVEVVMPLGFGKCRISLAVPRSVEYTGPQWFDGRRIATSYPTILRRYLDEKGIHAEIHEIAGSVEVAPAVGMADAIFDIVSSGGTLVQNGLVEVEQVFPSEAAMICRTDLDEEKRRELEKLCFRFRSIIDSRGMKYVLMNLREESIPGAVALIPGMKSPTLMPLSEPGWYSLHTVIAQEELWEKIEKLKELGAEDILVLALENIVR